jgi:hypothetical protein
MVDLKQVEVSHEIPEELIEEGSNRKLQKVSKFNEVTVYEGSSSSDDDFEFAQETIRDTILKSNEVLQELGQAAILNENGKLYESYGQLMKNIVDSSTSLLDLHARKKKIDDQKEEEVSQNNTQINNNIFVGSSKDLLELIEQKSKA